MPRHANDAGTAGLNHFDGRAPPQAQFFEAMHLVGIAHDFANQGGLTGREAAKRNQVMHGESPMLAGASLKVRLHLSSTHWILSSKSPVGNGGICQDRGNP